MTNKKIQPITSRGPSAGFTLIELLVVISIIGLLTSIMIVSISAARQKAKNTKVAADLKQLATAVTLLQEATGKWPNGCPPGQASGPEADLDTAQAGVVARPIAADQGYGCIWTASEVARWNGPYAKTVGKDPWGFSYRFVPAYCDDQNQSNPAVISVGINGVLNTRHPSCPDSNYGLDDIFRRLSN